MAAALEFRNVSKLYRLGETGTSLREALMSSARQLFTSRPPDPRPELWAVRDLSFRVEAGQSLGIIGPNGAGKTTILKLLSRITEPTTGVARTRGRVSSLIELGAGFHPDLTGRDNIFLNGTILGMSRRQIERSFDEIVDFSGLERFLDTPVKRYSSGMYARLGFSVAAFTGAAVLLVDEVLAVGDFNFQAKCVERMRELVRNGTSVIFISHSLYYVGYFCTHSMLMHRGQAKAFGRPAEVIAEYQKLLRDLSTEEEARHSNDELPAGPRAARIVDVQVLGPDGAPREIFDLGETLVLSIQGFASERIPSPVVRFSIFSSEGVRCFSSHNRMAHVDFPDVEGAFTVQVSLADLRLMPDSYSVSVALLESTALGPYDWKEFCVGFRMHHPSMEESFEGGMVYLPHSWDFQASPRAPLQ
jgi:lipopolysaccharide transport system ATP-binding protein